MFVNRNHKKKAKIIHVRKARLSFSFDFLEVDRGEG